MSIHAFVATPCYGGVMCVNYVTSILRLQTACRQVGMPVEFDFHSGESLITRARNECAARFLEHASATHLLFVDADVGFSPQSAMRLLMARLDVVAGAYPLKCDELRFPVDYESIGPISSGFARASMVTTGFMCVARSVFERIRTKREDLRYETDDGLERFAFFETKIEGGRYLSEDYGFCRLWQSLGGDVFLDMTSDLTHQGRKLYSGRLAAELQRRMA